MYLIDVHTTIKKITKFVIENNWIIISIKCYEIDSNKYTIELSTLSFINESIPIYSDFSINNDNVCIFINCLGSKEILDVRSIEESFCKLFSDYTYESSTTVQEIHNCFYILNLKNQ